MIRFLLFFLTFSGAMLFFLDFVLFVDYKPAFRMLVAYYTVKTSIYMVVIFFYVYGMQQEYIDRVGEYKRTIHKLVRILEDKVKEHPVYMNTLTNARDINSQQAGGNANMNLRRPKKLRDKLFDAISDDIDIRR